MFTFTPSPSLTGISLDNQTPWSASGDLSAMYWSRSSWNHNSSPLYKSTNYGLTWSVLSACPSVLSSAYPAVSLDGTRIFYASYNNSNNLVF